MGRLLGLTWTLLQLNLPDELYRRTTELSRETTAAHSPWALMGRVWALENAYVQL